MLRLFTDYDPSIDYTERYPVYMSNMPAGVGYKNLFHYGQLGNMDSDGFQRYDHGSKEANNAHYGQDTPPAYDLSLIKFPLAVFSGS